MGTVSQSIQQVTRTNDMKCLLGAVLVGFAACSPYGPPVKAPAPTTEAPVPEKIIEATAAPVVCRTEYQVIWDTEYEVKNVETCSTVYVQQCQPALQQLCQNTTRQECRTISQPSCTTVYRKVCTDEYRTEYEPYTETECNTTYKEDCEFGWVHLNGVKEWAPIPGTCQNNSYTECQDVEKTQERIVTHPVCRDVPAEQCTVVDTEECYEVPDKICNSKQVQQCQNVPQQVCQVSHKKLPKRVSRKVAKKVCNGAQPVPHPAAPTDPLNRIEPESGDESFEFEEVHVPAATPQNEETEKLVANTGTKSKVNFQKENANVVF